jgi:hypothetical protein
MAGELAEFELVTGTPAATWQAMRCTTSVERDTRLLRRVSAE